MVWDDLKNTLIRDDYSILWSLGQGRFEVLRVCDKWQIEGYPDKVQHEVESGD